MDAISHQRRKVCQCIMHGTMATAFFRLGNAHAKTRPFCGYSLKDGWTGSQSDAYQGREFITHQATAHDASGIPQVIKKIYQSLSIEPDIDIYIAQEENNAFATVAGGKKIIVVDVNFVSTVNRLAKSNWGAIQVIAHELGHHIAGFSDDRHRAELHADYWSGQALQRLGAARIASTKAILAIGSETDTKTHPSKYRRAPMIEKGWDDARSGKIDYAFCDGCR